MHDPTVAFIIDDIVDVPPTNGVTYRFLSVASRICKGGNGLCLIGDRGGTNLSELKKLQLSGIAFPSPWLYERDSYNRLVSILRTKGIEILHVCNAHTMALRYGFRLANDLGARLVVDMHDINSDTMPEATPEVRLAEDMQQAFVGRFADAICVMSSADYGSLIATGISGEKLFYSPNGIDLVFQENHEKLCKEVVFLGNLFYPPNMEAAELIANQIAGSTRTADTQFIIVGPCPEPAVASLERPNVRVLGSRTNLSTVLSKASVGLAPLRSGSGMKVKILEYAKHQLPVVCTGVAAMGYPTMEGLIVRNSAAEFCAAIDWLLANPALRENLGRTFAKQIYSHFNWDRIIADLLDFYRRLLDRQPISRPYITSSPAGEVFFGGTKFPQPMHLLESRYLSCGSFQIKEIVEL